MFPYPHHCALTCTALRERLAHPVSPVERGAIISILESRMRRAAAA